MSRLAFNTPLWTVADVLQYLKSHWEEHMGDDLLSGGSPTEAMGCLQTHCLGLGSLPVRALLPEHHRIQFSIRGWRFEMPQRIALSHFLVFFLFFWLPLQKEGVPDADGQPGGTGNAGGTSFSLGEGVASMGGSVVQLVGSDGGGPSPPQSLSAEQLTRVLTRHYQEVVWPCLVKIMTLLCRNGWGGDVRDLKDSHGSTVPKSTPENVEPLLPIPMAEVVSWDGATRQWRFGFLNRLPDDVEKTERERLNLYRGCKGSSYVGDGSDKAGAGDALAGVSPNENPLLLLQPHYVGSILVYVRRLSEALVRPASDEASGWPVLAIRWAELNYDQQLCVSQVVRALGVVPLIMTHSAPIAPITTSQYMLGNARASFGSGGECGAGPPREQGSVSRPATGSETFVGCGEDWIRQGCVKCGISGHSTVECPY
ncbi:unnamed protein product [Phytomonas sp. EM1]|nr:unnamed protein product [Phytomonas sp. EM1]|eukprot:CCW64599.1 unnamed protein product [Phytomonas sp. isolate EM1]